MSRLRFAVAVALALLPVVFTGTGLAQEVGGELDIVIRGGTVIDGTGTPAVRADVGIRGGRIVAVGDLTRARASRSIDADGLTVSPGFIDMHSHAEVGLSDPYLATAANNLLQGVTTVVVGQDGRHAWPLGGELGAQVALWRRQGIGNNIIPLAGHGSARLEVMGVSTEPATEEEKAAIRSRIEAFLAEGAFGLSSGLGYDPGKYSPPEEVIDAARPLARYGGFYISHIRDQSDGFLESVKETIRLGRETSVPVVVSHIKVGARRNWGKATDAVELMDAAWAEGVPVYGDLYPYNTSIEGLNYPLVPAPAVFNRDELRGLVSPEGASPIEIMRWAYRLDPNLRWRIDESFLLERPAYGMNIGLAASRSVERQPIFRRRIRDLMHEDDSRAGLLKLVDSLIEAPGGADLYRILYHPDPALIGSNLAKLADARSLSPAEAAIELTLEGATFLQVQLSEQDIITFIKKPYITGGSDGDIPEFGYPGTHPRSYGTFTRRILRYVYELGVIDLPFAVQTATGRAAEIIGLTDRGLLKVGQWADVLIFDPKRLTDRANYKDVHAYSEGIEWVLVNGEVVVEAGRVTGHRAGQVLLKTEAEAKPRTGREPAP